MGVDPGRPWRYLWIDLGFWTLGGLLVTAWNAPNAYFTMVVKAVHQHGGVLDKFVGDAALAVFGLAECENASEDALRATLEIQEGLEELNRELGAEGYPTLRNGNGIHFGQVVAGNIGSEERLEYTVIGDAVNTASRLQDLTKEIPTTVAVSGETYERIESETRETLCYVGSCSLKGKSDEIPVYGLAREVEAAGDGKTGNDSSGGRT
ncbi:MAG: adenylate/guanylate cyclase domain-containing protein [Candidatus Latescibacteria bacterium]|nr:adenylate/guanylate cyclase domain-containing protein [Candidatus Latescibacterota bacterium]